MPSFSGHSSQKVCKKRYQSFLVLSNFAGYFYFIPNIFFQDCRLIRLINLIILNLACFLHFWTRYLRFDSNVTLHQLLNYTELLKFIHLYTFTIFIYPKKYHMITICFIPFAYKETNNTRDFIKLFENNHHLGNMIFLRLQSGLNCWRKACFSQFEMEKDDFWRTHFYQLIKALQHDLGWSEDENYFASQLNLFEESFVMLA